MEKSRCSCCLLLVVFILASLPLCSVGQLTQFERRILFRVQKLLEFPPALQGWSNWTNFCYLPPSPSLTIVCSGNHVTELTVIGNKTSPPVNPKSLRGNFSVSDQTLSEHFSIDSFVTTITKLWRLKVLTLASLGLWGPLPAKINRFRFLQFLNISSNFIYGEIPPSIASYKYLRSLVLADNLFNGTVPNLTSLAFLQELDLSDNLLGPKFPSLGNDIVSVILNNNTFQTEIPLELKSFNQMQRLDISSNQLNGSIPTALFSLPSLQYLNMASNQLKGSLETNISCSDKLGFVDLSNNQLTGRLPPCIESNSSNRIVLYSWNCLSSGNSNYQHLYSSCYPALAVLPTTPKQKHHSSNKLGLILGIGGGIVGGVLALGLLLFFIFRKVRANNRYKKSMFNSPIRSSPVLLTDTSYASEAMRFGALGLPPYHEFTLEEIEEATNNFDPSNLLGQGLKGQLYKGWLRDGSVVVVRCLKLKDRHSPQSLLQHMDVISKLRHRHLVGILGHCIVTYQDHPNAANSVYLVFEYISNGTLRSHLTDWRKREALKWSQRMAVTIGIARGIQFLHTGIAPGIFGNDLKTENILMDGNLSAKINSYNLPLPARVGSDGPFNKHSLGHLSSAEQAEKEDIYQLGAIVVEVITGKTITSQSVLDELKLQLEKGLTDAPAKLRAATDPAIRGTFAYESLRTAVEITTKCLSKDPSQRPSIEDVLWNLQYSVQVQDGWTSSGNLSGMLSGRLSGKLSGRLSGNLGRNISFKRP